MSDYEDLKTTHIEKVEAIRAEYLEKFLAATTRIKELETERDALFEKTKEQCAQVADPVRPDLANAIRALKEETT